MTVRLFDPEGQMPGDPTGGSTPVTLDRVTDPDRLVDEAGGRCVLVAVGEAALLEYVRRGGSGPVLPIGVDGGVPAVDTASATTAVESLADGHETVSYPTIDASRGEDRYRALMDVMAVTAEPARISEYKARKVETDTVIDQVRADGIVVSGPAGTPGYGTAAGGPMVDRDLGGMSVVPVSPFRTSRPRWVVAPPIEIEVTRGEVPVSLLVDDEEVGRLPAADPLTLDWAGPLDVAVVEESVATFSQGGASD